MMALIGNLKIHTPIANLKSNFSGKSEGAREQCDNIRATISEMMTKRADCPEAISDVRLVLLYFLQKLLPG